jgi:hypothetical protein
MMNEIEALTARIDQEGDVDALRIGIADLTSRLIRERRDNLGYWEKHWFAQTLAALAWNVGGGHRDSTAWLRLSLVALETALTPQDRRNESYTPRNAAVEALTADTLLVSVRALGASV